MHASRTRLLRTEAPPLACGHLALLQATLALAASRRSSPPTCSRLALEAVPALLVSKTCRPHPRRHTALRAPEVAAVALPPPRHEVASALQRRSRPHAAAPRVTCAPRSVAAPRPSRRLPRRTRGVVGSCSHVPCPTTCRTRTQPVATIATPLSCCSTARTVSCVPLPFVRRKEETVRLMGPAHVFFGKEKRGKPEKKKKFCK